ncbi:MAG: hypothetical protein ACRCZ9_02540 [Fusobacteriaceae bacterium]
MLRHQLSLATLNFIDNGTGSCKSAKDNLLSIPDAKSYSDYVEISQLIYTACMKFDRCSAAAKILKPLDLDVDEYYAFIDLQMARLQYPQRDELGAALWVLSAASGCRQSELSSNWKVQNGFLQFDAGKDLVGLDNNFVPSLVSLIKLMPIKALLNDTIPFATITKAIANFHKRTVIKALPALEDHPPKVTRDIYQTIAVKSMPTLHDAKLVSNHAGHRNPDSGVFTLYASSNFNPPAHNEFIRLHQVLSY